MTFDLGWPWTVLALLALDRLRVRLNFILIFAFLERWLIQAKMDCLQFIYVIFAVLLKF